MTEVMCVACYTESNMRNMDPEWMKRNAWVCSTCVADPRPLYEINPDEFYDPRAQHRSEEE